MGPNTVEILTTAALAYSLTNVKTVELEKVSLSNIKNLCTVSEHIDCWSQVFYS